MNPIAMPADAALTEIPPQPLGVGARICQGDVAIRPDEIERRAFEAGSPHSRLPREMMQRQPKCGAGFGQAASRFTVNVDLPGQRRERGEVVFSRRGFDPGQTIAAANGPGHGCTQWAVAIVDADLRGGLKQEAAQRTEPKQQRCE